MITVVRPGLQCTIQDLGRPGVAHLGVPRAGAANPPAYRRANGLVGNPDTAAALEFLLGGFAVRFDSAARYAVTGAPLELCLDGQPVSMDSLGFADAGAVLTAGRPRHGLRSYLAVAGGIDVPPVLGSRSTDTLSGLGPPTVIAGAPLPTGDPSLPVHDPCPAGPPPRADPPFVARFSWGPRDDWFTPQARRLLVGSSWRVSTETDRIAARLDGPRLRYAAARDLPSEGLPLGAIQVPPSGQPIIHLANHPPTGGYPVIGVVVAEDVWRIGDMRPGTELSLRPGSPSPERD